MNRLKDIRFVEVKRWQHIRFNVIELSYFINSEGGVAMPFGRANSVSDLFVIPYVLLAEAIFFRAQRFYMKIGERVVGEIVLRVKPYYLDVASLGIGSEYRRSGLATCALTFAEEAASQLRKKELRLSVLAGNLPAQRLYLKFGFSVIRRERWSLKMGKAVKRSVRKC